MERSRSISRRSRSPPAPDSEERLDGSSLTLLDITEKIVMKAFLEKEIMDVIMVQVDNFDNERDIRRWGSKNNISCDIYKSILSQLCMIISFKFSKEPRLEKADINRLMSLKNNFIEKFEDSLITYVGIPPSASVDVPPSTSIQSSSVGIFPSASVDVTPSTSIAETYSQGACSLGNPPNDETKQNGYDRKLSSFKIELKFAFKHILGIDEKLFVNYPDLQELLLCKGKQVIEMIILSVKEKYDNGKDKSKMIINETFDVLSLVQIEGGGIEFRRFKDKKVVVGITQKKTIYHLDRFINTNPQENLKGYKKILRSFLLPPGSFEELPPGLQQQVFLSGGGHRGFGGGCGARGGFKGRQGGARGGGFGGQGTVGDREPGTAKELFVKNLSYNSTRDSLMEAFEGAISARIATFPDFGKSKGFGFVEFDSHDDCKAAYEAMQGQAVDGRKVTIDYAVERDKGGGQGGGRGGFGGGRGTRGRVRGGRGGGQGGQFAGRDGRFRGRETVGDRGGGGERGGRSGWNGRQEYEEKRETRDEGQNGHPYVVDNPGGMYQHSNKQLDYRVQGRNHYERGGDQRGSDDHGDWFDRRMSIWGRGSGRHN